eukprot:m51a1_g14462 hypothetical protein (656) ;mRNA; r:660155-662389
MIRPCARTVVVVDLNGEPDMPIPALVGAVSEYYRLSLSLLPSAQVAVIALGDGEPVPLTYLENKSLGGLVRAFASVKPGGYLNANGIKPVINKVVDYLAKTSAQGGPPKQAAPVQTALSLRAPDDPAPLSWCCEGDSCAGVVAARPGSSAVSCRWRLLLVIPHQQLVSPFHYVHDPPGPAPASAPVAVDAREALRGALDACGCDPAQQCDVAVVKVCDEASAASRATPESRDARVHASVSYSAAETLKSELSSLAARHLSLMRVRVAGVAMRSLRESEPSARTVELWARAAPEHCSCAAAAHGPLELTWVRTDPARLTLEARASSCAHRVATMDPDDAVGAALLRSAGPGCAVALVQPGRSADGQPTHALVRHPSGAVLLHCLLPLPLLPDLPPLSADTSVYRMREFLELVDENMVCAPGQQQQQQGGARGAFAALGTADLGEEGVVQSPPRLERQTRYFPWLQSETTLFGSQYEDLKKLSDQLKHILTHPQPSQVMSDTGCELVSRVYECAQSNEARFFPLLRTSLSARKEAYRKLWVEIHRYVRLCNTTREHAAIQEHMERRWPEPLGLRPSAPAPMDVSPPDDSSRAPQQPDEPGAAPEPPRAPRRRPGCAPPGEPVEMPDVNLGETGSLLSTFWSGAPDMAKAPAAASPQK